MKSALCFIAGLAVGCQFQFFFFFTYYYNPLLSDLSRTQHELEQVHDQTISITNSNIQLARDVSTCQKDLDTCFDDNHALKEEMDMQMGGNPYNDDMPISIGAVSNILSRSNDGNAFSIKVYDQNDIVSSEITREGWENDKIKALTKHYLDYSKDHGVPLSDLTFVDIGANVGWFSLNMAALGVKVLAFEPMKENLDLLEASLKLDVNIRNGISERITIFKLALGVKDETCVIYSDDVNIGDGHVKCIEGIDDLEKEKDEVAKHIPADYSIREIIEVRRLDDVLQEHKEALRINEADDQSQIGDDNAKNDGDGLTVVGVKMDTEGYEANVLKGGKAFFLKSGVDVIMSEFNVEEITKKGGDPAAFIKAFSNAGYKIVKTKKKADNDESANANAADEGANTGAGATSSQEEDEVSYWDLSSDELKDMKNFPEESLTLHSTAFISNSKYHAS